MQGIITKGIGGFYTVRTDDGSEFVCFARGKFRRQHIIPCVGDIVEFNAGNGDANGYLVEIMPRRNCFVRPPVANLDKLLVVLSASLPTPDLLLADKLLAVCELYSVEPVLIINKCDCSEKQHITELCAQYSPAGYKVICVSAQTGEGVSDVLRVIEGSTCAFAGQSAVGKTSLLNAILPSLNLPVGELSERTEHGRHTTRHVQLYSVGSSGVMLDTPGFSLIDMLDIPPEQLPQLYPEMRDVVGKCRFIGCLHVSEPDCAIKELISQGKLSNGRYERYLRIIAELSSNYKHRYD